MKRKRSFGTHDGTFHSDEVTACALFLYFDLIDADKIVRTRESRLLETCEYVCDVGGEYDPSLKRFDHHQKEYEGECSSAGLVLLYLKDIGIMSEGEYDHLNHVLVRGVDEDDNGQAPQIAGLCTYSDVIANFLPIEYGASESTSNRAFNQALLFAKGHIERAIKRYRYILSMRNLVAEQMRHNREYLLFEEPLPWQDSFFALGGASHPAQFVIMRSGEHWNLRGIPPSNDRRMEVRIPQPEEWAGKLEEELSQASGIKGGIFSHKGRFISVWETKESAFEAMEKAKIGIKK